MIFTDKSVVSGNTFAYESTVANEIRGIGVDIYDATADYGSAGRLRSVVVMDNLSKFPDNPTQKVLGENNTLSVIGQEAGHRWLAFLRFRDADGRNSTALLGRDLAHWSFFFNSDASVMEGNKIDDLGGGAFKTVDAVKRYSALDQYAMGLLSPTQVPDFFYVDSPTNVVPRGRDATSAPEIGVTFNGTRRDVKIQDVIDGNGVAQPDLGEQSARASAGVHLPGVGGGGGRPDAGHQDGHHPPGVGRLLRTGDQQPHAGADLAQVTGASGKLPPVVMYRSSVTAVVALLACVTASGPDLDLARLELIEPLVSQAIADHQLPGAVVFAGIGDRVLYRKAMGNRALRPSVEPMTLDTIFDLASLTKVVATTTAVMQLVEDGKVRLVDRVSAYIPGFERYGKDRITIRHLLTHTSGLRPDLELEVPFEGKDEAIRRAIEEVPTSAPGDRFVYSDINFFLLGRIVERISGDTLDAYTRRHIFEPLAMHDTTFLPPATLVPRIAPTEACEALAWPCDTQGATMLRGVVHDPTARRMGGYAGHAGLFSTGEDLSVFVRMLLAGGTWNGARILSPLTVETMTRAAADVGGARRGLGWDVDSSYSSNRGELLPVGSFGHTGFTGTSIWADPLTGVWVIFLSNRVHPDGHGDVGALRSGVATIVASAATGVTIPPEVAMTGRDVVPAARPASVAGPAAQTGLDVLREEGFARLRGKRVGLVTNHTGRAADGTSTIDLLHAQKDFTLVALFSPEHGIRGVLDESVPSTTDQATGLPIHSLYGATRRPTDEMFAGIDTMVIDLQDIGTRFYTYPATMAYVMEESAKRGIPVLVLDRPNPIGGWQIEGPKLDQAAFTGYLPAMPVRHGMTLGELARLFNSEAGINCSLDVVPMANWRRSAWFDETNLEWINPSPNMRNLVEATLYPGIGMLEYGNLSVGRGTDTPFEQIGAPWIDGRALAAAINARNIPGVRVYPVRFTPASSNYAGEVCQGVFFVVTDREALRPVRLGVEVAAALVRLNGERYDMGRTSLLLGSSEQVAALRSGGDPTAITGKWASDEARWRLLRAKYLLY